MCPSKDTIRVTCCAPAGSPYITFQYTWPGLKQNEENRWDAPDIVCLSGKAPLIVKATELTQYPGNSTPKCNSVARVNPWSNDAYQGLGNDSIFIPQNDSEELTNKLNDPKLQAVVRIRVGEDGYIRPITLKFRPRPPGTRNENGFVSEEDIMSQVNTVDN